MQWLWLPGLCSQGKAGRITNAVVLFPGYQAFVPRGRLGRLLTHNAMVVATQPLLPWGRLGRLLT